MLFFQKYKIQFEKYKILYKKNRKLFNNIFRFIFALIFGLILSVLITEIDPFKSYLKTTSIPDILTKSLVYTSNFLLNLFGFDTYAHNNFLQIRGTNGIRFVYSCIGIRHMTFFAGFIISYYGKLLNKIWYIIVGFIILIFINSFRASIICITQLYYPEYFQFVHYYFTRIIMYVCIFVLWMIWIRFFATKKRLPETDSLKTE
ncbi:MAG: archaeosortase/exosortase family protein [Bacteroidetes bacterium]|nr:archaeosortase/exosortase family protein [Bacteroidota bacterium]